MKKTTIGILLLSLAAVSGLEAETFVHKFKKGEKYRIVATVEAETYFNDAYAGSQSYLNKISVAVKGVTGGTGQVSELYQVSMRQSGDAGSYQMEEEMPSSFSIDSQGRYAGGLSYFYPLTRSIPLFPVSDMEPGFTWTARGEDAHDLRSFGLAKPLRFPVDVRYSYLGMKEVDGKALAQFEIEYAYDVEVKGFSAKKDQVLPTAISGANRMILNWDPAGGRPDSYEEEFEAVYHFPEDQTAAFKGRASAEVILSEPLDQKETVEDIKKEIDKEKLEGVKVEPADQGVKITLENIQFEPDSDRITEAEAHKIETIASILKKYPDRDVKLVGHTAAVGTPESCMDLSIRRAKAVGDALIELEARTPEQMTIQGKGLTEPLAANKTEAGRIKNRRVEIFLLEN